MRISIYWLTFTVSLFILSISERTNSKKKSLCLKVLAILLTSGLAGFRAVGVGIDTTLYADSAYRWALAFPFSTYIELFSNSFAFYTIWYILTNIFRSTFAVYFFVEVTIETLVLAALEHKNKKVDQNAGRRTNWIGMAVYYFIFYSYSLNLMRQSIAVAIVMFAMICYLEENRNIKYLFSVFIAFLFHNTAIVGLAMMFCKGLYNWINARNIRRRILLYLLSFVSLAVIFLVYSKVLGFIASVDEWYMNYINTTTSWRGTFNSWIFFAFLLIWGCIVSICLSTYKEIDNFYYYLIVIGLCIFWINVFSNNAYRLSFYCLYSFIYLYPHFFSITKDLVSESYLISNRKIIVPATVFVLFVIWYILFVIWETNGIVPYHSDILGI